MTQWLSIAAVAMPVFAVIAVGMFIRRVQWLSAEADATLLKLVVRLLLPCLIFHAIVGNEKLTEASNIIIPPAVGFISIVIGLALGWLCAKLLGKPLGLDDPAKVRTFAMCVAIYNYGYIPIPLVADLFSDNTLGILFVHNLGVEIALWTLCIAMLSGSAGGHWQWLKRVINPPSMAIVAALVINFLPLPAQYPPGIALVVTIVSKSTSMLAQCSIPLSLLLVGATAADHMQPGTGGVRRSLRVVSASCAVRLVLLPAVMIAAAVNLPISIDLKQVMVVQAAMPAAVIPIVLAKHYGGDTLTALRVALGTSVVSLITIPFVLQWGMRVTQVVQP